MSAAALVAAGAPGAVVSIDGDAVAAGLADVDGGEPMTVAHRFRIGSVTKTYVGALALLLVEEGVVDLDATGVVAEVPELTLRLLLSHRSGLANYMDGDEIARDRERDPFRRADPARSVAAALREPRLFAPGESVSYCNTNYQAAGLALERAAGAPLEDLLRARIFAPLELARTTFATESIIEEGLATGYAFADGWYPAGEVTAHLDGAWADGAIVADAADVAAFFTALLGGQLLTADRLAEMKRGALSETGRTAGLGLIGYPGRPVWGHNGDMPGYTAAARALEDGSRVVVALVNAQGAAFAEAVPRAAEELI